MPSPSPISRAWLMLLACFLPALGQASAPRQTGVRLPRTRLGEVERGLPAEGRQRLLHPLPLGELIVAPGHSFVDDPAAVRDLSRRIVESGGAAEHKKIILNIVTAKPGERSAVASVDIWTGHRELAAYVQAGRSQVGQIRSDRLEILVNGETAKGEQWEHWVRAAGADLEKLGSSYRSVAPAGEVEPGTIAVSGRLSNRALGSRTTLGAFWTTMDRPRKPRVAVFFGTFDPIHEGHMKLTKDALTKLGFDEVLIVPGWRPEHKPHATPIAHRLAMVAARLGREKGVKLYRGNSSLYLDRFGPHGLEVFMDRVRQLYRTEEVFTIVGQDAYENGLLPQNRIQPGMKQRYLVFARGRDGRPPYVPPGAADQVVFVPNDDKDYSSSAVRKKIGQGQEVPPEELHTSVLRYIMEHNLYR